MSVGKALSLLLPNTEPKAKITWFIKPSRFLNYA